MAHLAQKEIKGILELKVYRELQALQEQQAL
jgi:hypothetical protein